jgi:hypothetical protein
MSSGQSEMTMENVSKSKRFYINHRDEILAQSSVLRHAKKRLARQQQLESQKLTLTDP